jgi:hypothetical protein
VAAIIYAVPPVIRLVEIGIRTVPPAVREAGVSSGATPLQLLRKVELPVALPALLVAMNQGIILVLAMVVVGGLVGAGGLGYDVVDGFFRRDFFGEASPRRSPSSSSGSCSTGSPRAPGPSAVTGFSPVGPRGSRARDRGPGGAQETAGPGSITRPSGAPYADRPKVTGVAVADERRWRSSGGAHVSRKGRLARLIGGAMVVALAVGACNTGGGGSKGTVNIAINPWVGYEADAARATLKEELGYTVVNMTGRGRLVAGLESARSTSSSRTGDTPISRRRTSRTRRSPSTPG